MQPASHSIFEACEAVSDVEVARSGCSRFVFSKCCNCCSRGVEPAAASAPLVEDVTEKEEPPVLRLSSSPLIHAAAT